VEIPYGLAVAVDLRDESVPAAVQRLNEPRIIRIVAERRAEPFDGGVEAVLEIDKRARRPQAIPQLFARDDFPRAIEHDGEDLERLILQPDADASLPQLTRTQIDLEGSKSLHVRGTSFEGQHKKREVYQPARAFAPSYQSVNVA
jgi:hypothetical protein